jgi:hypothetical protein
MAAKRITLAKVEIAEYALAALAECVDIEVGQRAALAAAASLVTSLRPRQPEGVHSPVLWAPGIVGCSCGDRPAKMPSRASMLFSGYRSHLARIGVPDTNQRAVVGYGPDKGRTL